MEMISNAINSILTKISAIIYGKRKYTLSTDWMKDDFSIAYTRFPLPKECKHVQVYYAREAIFEYKNMISFIIDYVKNDDINLISIMDTIIKYIDSWGNFKELSPSMLTTLNDMIKRRREKIALLRKQYNAHLSEFHKYNEDIDTLVDNFIMTLFRNSSEIQYIRIFKHFFKKGAFDLKYLQKRYTAEISKLEQLNGCIRTIQRVREYSGKSDEITRIRSEAVSFLNIINHMTSLVEQDLDFIEEMANINKLVIAFKVYPYYGDIDSEY